MVGILHRVPVDSALLSQFFPKLIFLLYFLLKNCDSSNATELYSISDALLCSVFFIKTLANYWIIATTSLDII